MRKRLFGMPAQATTVACSESLLSLGSVSYAAISILNNSVGIAQPKTNAVVFSKVPTLKVNYLKERREISQVINKSLLEEDNLNKTIERSK